MDYPLFGFEDSRTIAISRGRNSHDVLNHIMKDFPRGSTIAEMIALPINAGRLYDKNHSPEWLNRIPDYLHKVKSNDRS